MTQLQSKCNALRCVQMQDHVNALYMFVVKGKRNTKGGSTSNKYESKPCLDAKLDFVVLDSAVDKNLCPEYIPIMFEPLCG